MDPYRLRVSRAKGVADPMELAAPLDALFAALKGIDPLLFTLSGHSPAMEIAPLDSCARFLAVSEIGYGFGRQPGDPRDEVIFFNAFKDGRDVYFRLKNDPGLSIELRLGTDAAGPRDSGRGAHLQRLFGLLVKAIGAESGRIELPGHPEEVEAGWLTFRDGRATLQTPTLGLEGYEDLPRR